MNDRLNIILDSNDYDEKWPLKRRVAVRGVICKNNKYALIQSKKYGEFKFPGGGMEANETFEDTLIREVAEETGMLVDAANIEYLGDAVELCRDDSRTEIFHHISHYYLCDITNTSVERNLDDYEAEYGYELKWITLSQAVMVNNNIVDKSEIPWVYRDTLVMEKILELTKGKYLSFRKLHFENK